MLQPQVIRLEFTSQGNSDILTIESETFCFPPEGRKIVGGNVLRSSPPRQRARQQIEAKNMRAGIFFLSLFSVGSTR